jgi:hypothetical protein
MSASLARCSPSCQPDGAPWPRTPTGSPWSTTPARTPRPTRARWQKAPFISWGPCRRATTPTCWRSLDPATGLSTRGASGVVGFETRVSALGGDCRVIVTHSEDFHAKQARGFDQTLAKARRQLGELAERLARGKTRKNRTGIEAEIASITRPRWVSRVTTTTLSGTRPSTFALSFAIDATARKELEEELFGKRVLFTDREDWSMADVVGANRSQHYVESDFRQMKDRKVVSFNPMFHWTDDKIRVHAFYCVLALGIARLMHREAHRSGLDMSVRKLLSTLGEIEETVLLYQGERGRPRARRMLTEMDPDRQHLYDLFGLAAYAPKR